MRLLSFFLAIFLFSNTSFAKDNYLGKAKQVLQNSEVRFSLGYYDVIRAISENVDELDEVRDRSADTSATFTLEYRYNREFFAPVKLKPIAGALVTGGGDQFYHIGVARDFKLYKNLGLSLSFAPGYYIQGDNIDLNNGLEFKSAAEISYKFKNDSNIGFGFSHLSNASIGSKNPGTEVAYVFYTLPLRLLIK